MNNIHKGLLAYCVLMIVVISGCASHGLYWAADNGNMRRFNELILQVDNVDCTADFGRTPLMAAAYGGHIEIVRRLIEEGADVNLKDILQVTPIIFAAGCSSEVVEILIEAGAEVNAKNFEGRTALHHAAIVGDYKSVEILLKNGANINEADDRGFTPLMNAAGSGDINTFNLLLREGADPFAGPFQYLVAWAEAGKNKDIISSVVELANKNKDKLKLQKAASEGD